MAYFPSSYLAAAVYFAVQGIDIRETVYQTIDWPLIVTMLIVINLYYLVYFILVIWRKEGNAEESGNYRQVIIVQVAAKNIPIKVQDIAYFFGLAMKISCVPMREPTTSFRKRLTIWKAGSIQWNFSGLTGSSW